jgi:hypothetical protein
VESWPALFGDPAMSWVSAIEQQLSPVFEIAPVLVGLDHIASRIVNANHGIM